MNIKDLVEHLSRIDIASGISIELIGSNEKATNRATAKIISLLQSIKARS